MSTNKKIVSIVEDELDLRRLFHDALRRTVYGVSVVSFNDPADALKHFKDNKESYLLVIADWRLPNLNGLELVREVKEVNPEVRTILISAYEVENEALFQRFMREGIIDKFIQKPMTMNKLCMEVNNQVQASNAG